MSEPPQTKLIKPRTKAGKRVLEKRAPKLVRPVQRLPPPGWRCGVLLLWKQSRCARRRNACMLTA